MEDGKPGSEESLETKIFTWALLVRHYFNIYNLINSIQPINQLKEKKMASPTL